MNNLSIRKFLLFVLLFSLSVAVCEAQSFKRYPTRHPGRSLSRKSPGGRSKDVKIREPRSVEKAKNKQAAKEKQYKQDYSNSIKDNRKYFLEIQTPEVQARMKENRKNADATVKAKKKKNASGMKKAGKKYRR
ncbi:MAG: hypothetical protein MUO72_11635 [Bacteroidales bacterium]|nr:hypothetical protein [Bacteroidales bacterium]